MVHRPHVEKKVTIGGIPNCLNYCEIFIVDIELTSVAADCKIQPGKVQDGNCVILFENVPNVVYFLWQPGSSVILVANPEPRSGFSKIKKTCVTCKNILAVVCVYCVRTYSEILLRDAICTGTTHSILYSDFLYVCIYMHIYNRTVTCIKTNKKCFYFMVTVLQH